MKHLWLKKDYIVLSLGFRLLLIEFFILEKFSIDPEVVLGYFYIFLFPSNPEPLDARSAAASFK